MRDWFADAFGDAVADIRQKLIEEGWFGRHPASPTSPTHSREGAGENDQMAERDARSRDPGIDR